MRKLLAFIVLALLPLSCSDDSGSKSSGLESGTYLMHDIETTVDTCDLPGGETTGFIEVQVTSSAVIVDAFSSESVVLAKDEGGGLSGSRTDMTFTEHCQIEMEFDYTGAYDDSTIALEYTRTVTVIDDNEAPAGTCEAQLGADVLPCATTTQMQLTFDHAAPEPEGDDDDDDDGSPAPSETPS